MNGTFQGLHDLVHLLINVVSVLNTLLLALDAVLGSSAARNVSKGVSEANSASRR